MSLRSPTVSVHDLPAQFRGKAKDVQGAAVGEHELLLSTLLSMNGNKSKAA